MANENPPSGVGDDPGAQDSYEANKPKWPSLICPECGKSIEAPRERLSLLVRPGGADCPYCEVKLRLAGNVWLGYGIGAGLLILGGRFFTKGFPFLLTVVFFMAGVAVFVWGLMTSALIRIEK